MPRRKKTQDAIDAHAASMSAAADERARFRAALASGKRVVLTTFSGDYLLTGVDEDFWYYTRNEASGTTHSWAGCNDGTWAKLLHSAGVARHPRNEQYAYRESPKQFSLPARERSPWS